ncbi:AraC family transcriptional regulator [Kiloniella laminariae]|uniref:AraC family transcriptional regulator n=1 Tax=Kiloniella laminariae TaxID=454162 RepID=A0ABT4LN11_9PROT|nr:AraC family transcriptional regulator [Kiloniella laminariae]MCZ4282506.1 AraC family transcriptional regulator [Kiloniella laminariae]
MTDTILDSWQSCANKDSFIPIIPDGCRDLILKFTGNGKPGWFASPLQDQTHKVAVTAGVFMKGYRLHPALRIQENEILAQIEGKVPTADEIRCLLEDFAAVETAAEEALICLASDVGTVEQASRLLGLSQRSLQRLLQEQTGRPPSFWLQLARVRKAARRVREAISLAELAYLSGFSDQAHMTREFQRWFGISPLKMRCGGEEFEQLHVPAYA